VPIQLNAGCGAHYVDGWLNVDVEERHRADVHADLADLPLADGSVTRVFAAHVLEHLGYDKQLPQVLAEFRRVLAPDGELCVVGPDIERAVILGEPMQLLRSIVAWPAVFNDGNWDAMTPPTGHAWTATGTLVEQALAVARFTPASYSGRLRAVAERGWPLTNFADYQNGYICRKEEALHVDR
jgi:SAM-dependent methyltransferase